MISTLPVRLWAAASMLIASLTQASASEDEFIFVDRMPDVRGDLARSIKVEDPDNGQTLVQELYALDYDHAVIETYVMTVTCIGGAARPSPPPYIVAIKYPPKNPATFAVATLHDIYKEVYALDQSGRIRLYEDVGGQSMPTLSERFKPTCLPI